jgi:SAM-dependent methyltransferase
VAGENDARLVFPADNPDLVRIDIGSCGTDVSHDVQLSIPRYVTRAGDRYSLGFLARADRPRSVGVGFARGRAPWTNLGLYERIELTPEWQLHEREFTATDAEENARAHFDAGGNPASVEVSSVVLRSLTEGRMLRQSVPTARAAPPDGVLAQSEREVQAGEVAFGSFRRVTPISHDFGHERGRPIDRYYIEGFLRRCEQDVRGRVLEVGERAYTRRFGGDRVTASDVLHVVEGDPEATIIADLTSAAHIPSDAFDCIILTQTLQLIYDLRAAVATLHRILKPGGVLLATFPGISQTYDTEWGFTWCWSLTEVSTRRLFGEAFGPANITVESFGNVLAAVCFLHGLSVAEVTPAELDYHEPGYAVTVALRAQKP